jgi:hypothetical protein
VHTYKDFISGLETADNVHLVEKTATSIGPLKEKIRACRQRRAGRKKS